MSDKDSITKEELFDVMEFARNIYNSSLSNVFTPDLINQRIQDVTLNPLSGEQDDIKKALSDPKNNEENLIGYSEYFELTSMIYKRLMYYFSNILAFSVKDVICMTAEAEDYHTLKYKKDYKIACDFLDKFNIKQEFSRVMRELMRNDAAFFILRDDEEGSKYTLQELPQKYCMITGRWDYGVLFDFNMYWFLQAGVDINMYPPVFKKMYNKVMYKSGSGQYKPSAPVDYRNGNWVLWAQTSPEDGFWGWKLTPELATRIPYLSPLLQDIALQPLLRNLQTNKYIIEATKVAIGLIPLIKDPKGGRVKDMIAISAETAGKFLSLLKKGLSDVVKIGAAPFEDVKTLDFNTTSNNLLDDYAKTTTSLSGVNSRLIYSYDKPNILETQLSLDVDVMSVSYMYQYFEDFINYQINTHTKHHKFKVSLGGINTTADRKDRLDQFNNLAAKGVVLPDRLAYALDMYPHDLIKQMQKAQANKFNELLMPMMNIYTGNMGMQNQTGRPQKETSDLTDSGAKSREETIITK